VAVKYFYVYGHSSGILTRLFLTVGSFRTKGSGYSVEGTFFGKPLMVFGDLAPRD